MAFQVEPLRRVRAKVEFGPAETDPPDGCSELTFIYGIGPAGVSPFECHLTGKQENDTISFRLRKTEAELFFNHLAAWFQPLFGGSPEARFRVRLTAIETPEPREVVKAIAEATVHGHGDGCDCGCGCR
jgi:hypothetical protein